MKPWAKKIIHYYYRLSLTTKIKWAAALLLLGWFSFSLPAALFHAPTSFVITDKDGNLLNASIANDAQWRFPYKNEVPEKFIKCITAFEDKRFYYHLGVDPMAMARALVQNIKHKKIVNGGSTLTMQVIRLHKQNTRRNLLNKIIECMLAVRMECTYRKKTILSLYACHAPFGGNVVGLEAASWRYFGRPANQLSWGEMAALAVLPNAPSLVHPGKNATVLLQKRNELLNKLAANKTIDETTCQLAKLESLPGKPKPLPQLAPHLLDRFKKDFLSVKRNKNLPTIAQTTIDSHLQQQVNAIVNFHHQQLKGNQIKNVAALVVDIETGNILSYVGNVYETDNPSIESHVDVLASRRSPGSTLKPLLYASLLTEGSVLPQQMIPDVPTQIAGYTPQNFDLGYDGAVPADQALARSLNIPAVKMLQQYKYGRFYEVLKKCGITTLDNPADHYGMSLILGGCEINPVELMSIYSSLARMYSHETENDGQWNEEDWQPLNYIHHKESNYKKSPKKSTALFDYTSLWHTFNAMTEVMRPGEEGLWNLFHSAQHIAWKTGTSFGFRDAWSIGITPAYGVLVWVGNTTGEGRPELIGINAAAPIMFDIFRLLPSSHWFRPPVGDFTTVNICRASGFKATPECSEIDSVVVSEQSVNAANCPYCKKIHLDPSGKFRVNGACLSPSKMTHTSWFILPPTIEYYYKQKHPDYKPLPPFMSGCTEDVKVLDIIYPNELAVIYVPVELSGEKGKTIFTATHKKNNAKLYWHLDNEFAGTTQNFHQLALNPPVGKHVITIVDESGNAASRRFKILERER